MLKIKLITSVLALALCAAAFTSCTGNSEESGNSNGNGETTSESGMISDIEEGVSEIESDVKDNGIGDREDATHGNESERSESLPRHRDAVPYGK